MTKHAAPLSRRRLLAGGLFVLVLVLAVAGLILAPGSATAATATVDMGDFAYVPQSITIPAGGRVFWHNKGAVLHNVTAIDGSWDSGSVEPGAFYSQVFAKPGVYRFYSRFYAGPDTDGMVGQVSVLAQTTTTPTPIPYAPDPSAIQVPDGYVVEVAATGLTVPASLTFDTNGRLHIAESGASFPTFVIPPTIKRLNQDGSLSLVAPATGSAFQINLLGIGFGPNGQLYASHNGRISRVNPDGSLTDLIIGLPSRGFHGNEHIAFGPDGRLYFSQGSTTNAGVIGPNPEGGPPPPPPVREIPCRNITLVGQNFLVGQTLTDTNGVLTGAYQSLGTPSTPNQVIPGAVPCGGAVLRTNLDGSNMEVAAWGFRNPYGIRFAPLGHPLAGRLFATNNGPDPIPPRPIGGIDELHMIANPTGATPSWHGWPDFTGGFPVNAAPITPTASFLWTEHPPYVKPISNLGVGTVPTGLDFSTSATFGYQNDLFVATWGEGRGPGGTPPSVRRVSFEVGPGGVVTPTITTFAVSKEPARIDSPGFGGLNHPIDVKFSPDGSAMYVADYANFSQPGGSGTIWRIRKAQQATVTPTTAPATATATASATPTRMTPTVTTTSQPATLTRTATAPPPSTGTATATRTVTPPPSTGTTTATATPLPPSTGTATVTRTVTPPPPATGTTTATATALPPSTGTATVTRTVTPPPPATGTTTVTATALPLATGTATVTRTVTPPPPATGTTTATATSLPPATGTATRTSTPPPPATTVPATATTTTTVMPTTPTVTQTTTPPPPATTVPATATTTATVLPITPTVTPTTTATLVAVTPSATIPAPTLTATRTATVTAVPPTATRTATPPPTVTPVVCSPSTPGNVCNGIVIVRAFIDFGCDGFFTRGTDWPLAGTTITVRLPDGSMRTSIVNENGDATLSNITLGAGQSVQVMVDGAPPLPTWVQQFGFGLMSCPGSPSSVTLTRAHFGVFSVAFVDFTYALEP